MIAFVPFAEVVVSPPALYVEYARKKLNANVAVAAQNCYTKASGAFTGDIRYSVCCKHVASHPQHSTSVIKLLVILGHN